MMPVKLMLLSWKDDFDVIVSNHVEEKNILMSEKNAFNNWNIIVCTANLFSFQFQPCNSLPINLSFIYKNCKTPLRQMFSCKLSTSKSL
jgi:hypothetical protein